jgi:serine protease Do
VKVQQVTAEMASALGLAQAHGAIVSWVTADGPAAQAGLQVGDVIVGFNDQQPSDERALLRSIGESAPGVQTRIDLLRDGQKVTLPITVQEWPRMQWEARDAPTLATPPRLTIPPDLGLTVSPITDAARMHLSDPKISGVLIAAVANGTDAADRGLQPGDVLLRIQDKTVTSREEMLAALEAARTERRRFVLALILPQTQEVPGPKWFALRLSEQNSNNP